MKKILCLVLSIVLVFVFSSCTTDMSISDKSVAQAVSVDLNEDDTVVAIQYLDWSKGTSTTDGFDNNITSVASGKGENIINAVSKASASLSGPIFFGQNKLIVIGEEYAKNGIGGINDYVFRGINSRPDVIVAISKDNAKDVVSSKENNAKVPAESMYDMIKTGESVGLSVMVNVNELLNMYNSKTADAYLPCLSVSDDKSYCDGIMLFSEDKPCAVLDEDETFGFLLLKNLIRGGTINTYDDILGNVGFEIKNTKVRRKTYCKDDTIFFDADLMVKIILNDVQKGIAVKISPEDISRLETLVSNECKNLCISAVQKCIDNQSDAFSFGRELAKYSPAKYNDVQNNWHNEMKNIKFSVNVSTKLEQISDKSIRK